MRRFAFRGILALIVLGGGAWLALQALIGSGYATQKVANRLSAKFGVPVTVGGLEVGGSSCSASDLVICEADSSPGMAPFLTIARAESDLGLTELLQSDLEPDQITLTDVRVILRHDRAGHLLTKLPKPTGPLGKIPTIQLQNAVVTIRKEGEADCTFQGIDATIHVDAGQLSLKGTVADPNWGGKWQAAGSAPLDGSSGVLQLSSAMVHVTPEELRRVPFVSAKVWQHFVAEGDTPVNLRLSLGAPQMPVTYNIELAPEHTSLDIPSIALKAANARGKVTIDNGLVVLRDVHGQVAEGELHLKAGELDFRQPNSVMHFEIAASRLNLSRLPASWRLPPQLGGKLSGQADLVVRNIGGRSIPAGSGEGRVDDARLAILPIPNYGLRIQADANGFRFEPLIGSLGLLR